ncbi:glucose transporter/sensor [Suhomyces tanzawaensis NRRL Y-17324]|uniref:Glucose transporter/sensor n=1 Tax=Suhomyces tanzawaensis NRRL Y-17324 TaxID=984487 RepID=A0A1E4SP38_9ASCO|nr:glucose transporter/sensor [Suhomyces tanzawaensis NRRL Y-17324]ODV81300.1 glucose transporter/sensor [Suhomyces tanzawaensis NRRL Y-17324]
MGLEDNKLLQKYINFGEKKAGSTTMGILVGLFAAFGGLLFGYDTGTISGVMAMKYVKQQFPKDGQEFSSSESSLIVSILSVGTFFGALGAPLVSDRIGRRWTLIIATLFVFNLGVVLQTAATAIPLLCAGRAIAGFGVGLISAVIPLYQAETVPKWIRGAVISCYQWTITIGLFLASLVNQGTHNRNDSGSYRIPIAIQFLWALILGVGMIVLPETPRFFVSRSNEEAAKDSLRRLRKLPIDHPDLVEEYEDIKAAYEYEIQFGKASWVQVFSTKNRQLKRIAMGTLMQAFQQLTGVNFIFYFGTTFFQRSGIKNSFLTSLATNIVNVGCTVPGIALVEIIGRRKLLLSGSVVMCISQFIVAIVGVAAGSSSAANKCLVAFVCIFIAAFAATWGPLAWAVCAEAYPLRVRQKSISLCVAANWLLNWAIAYATPYLVNPGKGNANLGVKVFFIWGGCNVLGGLFTYCMVYESKGLTLEQADEMWNTVPHAWNSPSYVPAEHAFRDANLARSLSSVGKEEVVSEVEEVSA